MDNLTVAERIAIEFALKDYIRTEESKARYYTEKQNSCRDGQEYHELEEIIGFCEKQVADASSALRKVMI